MKLKNFLPLLAIVCCFTACNQDENEDNEVNGGTEVNNGSLFKEPCVQWGASSLAVKNYMSGWDPVSEHYDNYFWLLYADIRTRNSLPYTIMYEYASETEYVYNPEIMEDIEVDKGLWSSSVTIKGTTIQQQEKINEEFIAFFDEKYNEVPLSSIVNEDWIYEDGIYRFEDEDLKAEIIGAYINDEKTVCVVVSFIREMEGNDVTDWNWIGAEYSSEF